MIRTTVGSGCVWLSRQWQEYCAQQLSDALHAVYTASLIFACLTTRFGNIVDRLRRQYMVMHARTQDGHAQRSMTKRKRKAAPNKQGTIVHDVTSDLDNHEAEGKNQGKSTAPQPTAEGEQVTVEHEHDKLGSSDLTQPLKRHRVTCSTPRQPTLCKKGQPVSTGRKAEKTKRISPAREMPDDNKMEAEQAKNKS